MFTMLIKPRYNKLQLFLQLHKRGLNINKKCVIVTPITVSKIGNSVRFVADYDTKIDTHFTRIVRQQPAIVQHGFIPETWITSFHNKTGVTGFYTFMFTFGMYLISKEKFVMEHEYYGGLSFGLLWYLTVTSIGPMVGKAIDKEIDAYENAWNEGRINEQNMLEESIKDEENGQWSSEGQLILIEAKRVNVSLQLEAEYRKRMMIVYTETKKRLDYQVELQNIETRMVQKNIVDWVTSKVVASITPEQESKNIDQCIANLAEMASRYSGETIPAPIVKNINKKPTK